MAAPYSSWFRAIPGCSHSAGTARKAANRALVCRYRECLYDPPRGVIYDDGRLPRRNMTMLGWGADILVLLAILVATYLLLVGLNRFWPVAVRSSHNELIGWQLGTLGTIYAVIMGFMLFTVWSNFSAAGLNVEMEANAARNLFRIAEGLPQAERSQVEELTRGYIRSVIEHDWPEMQQGQVPETSHKVNE